MKKIFRHPACLAAFAALACLGWSCDDQPEELPWFLDVNLKFSARVTPQPGQEVKCYLYYKEVKGSEFTALTPDMEVGAVLTEKDIAEGLRLTFDPVPREAEKVYVSSWVDIDSNGTLNKGDLAAFYGNCRFEDVASGAASPTNAGGDYAINLNHMLIYGDDLVARDATDIEGNVYKTVVIGGQVWFRENLRTTRFANGDAIPTGFDDTAWMNLSTPGYAQAPGTKLEEDGLHYNWYAASDARGLCPEGWTVPTEADWETLEVTIGMDAATAAKDGWRHTAYEGEKLKSKERGFGGSDEFGFSVLPSGERMKDNGTFNNVTNYAYIWTVTINPKNAMQAYRRIFRSNYRNLNKQPIKFTAGCNVRCIKVLDE